MAFFLFLYDMLEMSLSEDLMKEVIVPMAYYEIEEAAVAPVSFARETYIRKLEQHNILPIFASPAMSESMWDMLYERADGVFLMGGHDVSPELYGEEPHQTTTAVADQDRIDFYITKKALSDRKPILGICRGCQVLAVAGGGSLYQHLPDEFPEENHGTSESGNYNLVVEEYHSVSVDQDSRLYDLIGKKTLKVNTGHHQAIKKLGEAMVSAATSPAGVIEAIEHRDQEYFCFGIQSHPEVFEVSEFEALFEAFSRTL